MRFSKIFSNFFLIKLKHCKTELNGDAYSTDQFRSISCDDVAVQNLRMPIYVQIKKNKECESNCKKYL